MKKKIKSSVKTPAKNMDTTSNLGSKEENNDPLGIEKLPPEERAEALRDLWDPSTNRHML